MLLRGSLALLFGGCALALSACGGGSGSSGSPAIALPSTTPIPTASPTPGPDIPVAPGQSFTFNGTSTETQLALLPAPMPTATTVATVTQNGVIKDGQTFNGASGLYDDSVSESDATALKTTTSKTDTYYALSSPAPDGTSSLLEYGSTWADENSNTLTDLFAAPQTIGELPEKSGAAWTNDPAMTEYENDAVDANGSAISSTTVYAQDGTYVETTTYPPGYTFDSGQSVITQNVDGGGSITNVLNTGAVVFGSPQAQSNGKYLLPFAIYASPNPGPTAVPLQQSTVGAWYTVPVTLYHETDNDLGAQGIPSECNVPSSVATSAMQTERTVTRTDTVLGYTDTQTTDEYRAAGVGAVCVRMSDTQDYYYSYNGDQQFILSPSSDPTYVPTAYQINTINETLGLSAGAAPNARRAAAQHAAPISTAIIAAAQTHFQARIARLRARRMLEFVKAFKTFISKHHGGAR